MSDFPTIYFKRGGLQSSQHRNSRVVIEICPRRVARVINFSVNDPKQVKIKTFCVVMVQRPDSLKESDQVRLLGSPRDAMVNEVADHGEIDRYLREIRATDTLQFHDELNIARDCSPPRVHIKNTDVDFRYSSRLHRIALGPRNGERVEVFATVYVFAKAYEIFAITLENLFTNQSFKN